MKKLSSQSISNSLLMLALVAFLALPVSILHADDDDQSAPGSITTGPGPSQPLADPFTQMRQFQDRMEQVFQNLMGDQLASFPRPSGGGLGGIVLSPDLDMVEEEKQYLIELDLPGMEKDQINLEVQNDVLTVSGERKREESKEEDSEDSAYYYRGRSFGTFSHSLELPDNADQDKIGAKYEQGVLKITIPKKAPSKVEKPKKIKVA